MDEPELLEEWAARREQRRPALGERRVVPLGSRPEQAIHLDPEAPRLIQQWGGHQWIPAGVSENHAAAAVETGQDANARARRLQLPTAGKLPPMPEPWRPTQPWHRPET